MQNQKTMDTQQPNKTNTLIDKCAGCDNKVPVRYEKAERLDTPIGGRRFVLDIPEKTIRVTEWCEPCSHTNALDENEKYDQLKMEQKKKQIKEHRQAGIKVLGGSFVYDQFTFEKYKPKTESQIEAFTLCQRFNAETDNLYLSGTPGVGKSHLACAIARRAFDTGTISTQNIQRWRITDLLRYLRENQTSSEEILIINKIVNAQILVIEDIGAHKETDWSTTTIWDIIDKRIEKGINGLIVTSNFGRGKLSDQVGDRIPSRLSALCKIVKIDGEDFRARPI